MYQDQKNEYGCPLYLQSGASAIRNFAAIVERLPPEQRIAFEIERAARWAELERFLANERLMYDQMTAERIESAGARLQSHLQVTRWLLARLAELTPRVLAQALLVARRCLRRRCVWARIASITSLQHDAETPRMHRILASRRRGVRVARLGRLPGGVGLRATSPRETGCV